MNFEIRPMRADEFEAVLRHDGRAFGVTFPTEAYDDLRRRLEFDRWIVAVDDGEIIGLTGAFTFELTVPGPRPVRAGGVTWVGVAPTHRRRGVLRSLFEVQREDFVARGEPISILGASEGSIYERFGYGVSTRTRDVTIRTSMVQFRDDVEITGSCRILEADVARSVLPEIYERYRATRVGALNRVEAWWDGTINDPVWRRRDGGSTLTHVVHRDATGIVDGFASYRAKEKWDGHGPAYTLVVTDLIALNDAAHIALWHFLLHVDLVAEVSTRRLPTDDPLAWALTNPRAIATTAFGDELWLRIENVPGALTARRYAADGALVIDLGSFGRWRLEQRDGEVDVYATDLPADVTTTRVELGALFLGGWRPSVLQRAGRLHTVDRDALALLDAMFDTDPYPMVSQMF